MLKDLQKNKDKAQVTIEFTFAMIITMIMIFSIMYIFTWLGKDLVERRRAHDRILVSAEGNRHFDTEENALQALQLDTELYYSTDFNAIWERGRRIR